MTLAAKLAAYLGRKLGRPAEVTNLERISGGASRETYRFVLLPRSMARPLNAGSFCGSIPRRA